MSTEEICERAFLTHFIDEPLYLVPDKLAEAVAVVQTAAGDHAITAQQPPFEGLNQRGIVVVTDRLHDEDRTLLLKILQAVKLSMADIALFVASEFDGFACHKVLTFNHLMTFGTQLTHPNPSTLYKTVETENFRVLCAHALSHLAVHTADKRALWQSLQPFFM